jgi:polyhydroxyalkanoate synthesis regulator phasin
MAEILKNPAVKRALEMGEERMGRLVTQLLSNEKVMHGVQTMVSSALQAKSTFDRGVKSAMQAVNLPSSDDLEELRRKVAELESTVDGLNAKLSAPPGTKGENGA